MIILCNILKVTLLRITHPFATLHKAYVNNVKLACVKHTNSVHSEPGSNSYFLNRKLKNRFTDHIK